MTEPGVELVRCATLQAVVHVEGRGHKRAGTQRPTRGKPHLKACFHHPPIARWRIEARDRRPWKPIGSEDVAHQCPIVLGDHAETEDADAETRENRCDTSPHEANGQRVSCQELAWGTYREDEAEECQHQKLPCPDPPGKHPALDRTTRQFDIRARSWPSTVGVRHIDRLALAPGSESPVATTRRMLTGTHRSAVTECLASGSMYG